MLIDQWNFIIIIASIFGAAMGAKMSEAQPWKGAVVATLATIVSILIAIFVTANGFVMFIASLLVVGVCGGAMKLTGRQNMLVFLGMILGVAAAYFVADVVRYSNG